MNRHPLHQQNGSSPQNIALAKLLLAVDEAVSAGTWVRGDIPARDTFAVPMDEWSAVNESRKGIESAVKGHSDEATILLLATQIDSIDLRRCYHLPTRQVRIPVQPYADILTCRDHITGKPGIDAAYDTEHYIRHGQFPGRPRA